MLYVCQNSCLNDQYHHLGVWSLAAAMVDVVDWRGCALCSGRGSVTKSHISQYNYLT